MNRAQRRKAARMERNAPQVIAKLEKDVARRVKVQAAIEAAKLKGRGAT